MILLTGCAGFIGSHVLDRLVEEGHNIIGVDNFDPFYERAMKERNLEAHRKGSPQECSDQFQFLEADLAEADTYERLDEILDGKIPEVIIHLAAKGGIRPSIKEPAAYLRANVLATQQLLDYARRQDIPHFLFASCASVYGQCPDLLWTESCEALRPTTPYATTKLSCEHLGKVYNRHYGIRFTALRLFNVYGPRQRPDFSLSRFTKSILNDQPFPLYEAGKSCHLYTYIDDVVDGVCAAVEHKSGDFEIFNLGHSEPISQRDLVNEIEVCLGVRAEIAALPEAEEVFSHRAVCPEKSRQVLGFEARTPLADGINRFINWFVNDYQTESVWRDRKSQEKEA